MTDRVDATRMRWPLLRSLLEMGAGDMIVPVFTPAARIDAGNVAVFSKTVAEFVDRYGCMVIDCSEVNWIATVGMCALDRASESAAITLVNPNPIVHLMVATFATEVRVRHDRVAPPASEPGLRSGRLVSVHPCNKIAG